MAEQTPPQVDIEIAIEVEANLELVSYYHLEGGVT